MYRRNYFGYFLWGWLKREVCKGNVDIEIWADNDFSVIDRPHIRRWSLKITIQYYNTFVNLHIRTVQRLDIIKVLFIHQLMHQ